ncbi:MAG: isoprenylcysteine carboxylmethyltransferase family protein [Pseudomonadota bacterium]
MKKIFSFVDYDCFRVIFSNALPALIWIFLATRILLSIIFETKTSALTWLVIVNRGLFFTYMSMLTLMFVIRKPHKTISKSTLDWFYSMGGTFAPFAFRFIQTNQGLPVTGISLQLIGCIMSIVVILNLNRSMGILPANRGIKTGGIYRLVRHPLYTSYILVNLGFIFVNPDLYNACIFIIAILFQILRLNKEEKLLSKDPDYEEYSKRVRWKLLPFIY